MEMVVMTRLHLTPCWLEVKPSSWAAANNVARLESKRGGGDQPRLSAVCHFWRVTPVNMVADAKYKGVRK